MEQRAWYVEQLFATSGEQIVNENNGRDARATEALLDSEAGEAVFTWTSEMLEERLAINVGRNDGGQDAFLAIASGDGAVTPGTSGAAGTVSDGIEWDRGLASRDGVGEGKRVY